MTNIVTFPGLGLEFHLDRVAFSLLLSIWSTLTRDFPAFT